MLIGKKKINVTSTGNGMWDSSLQRFARTGETTATLLLSYNNKICATNVGMWDLSLHRSARTGEMTATLILMYNNKTYVANVGMWVMC